MKPFLIGLLVDVSASMGEEMADRSGVPKSRLEILDAALDGAFRHARSLFEEGG